MRAKVQRAFEERDWSNNGRWPKSGRGSTLENTERLREALPGLFKRYNVRRFVDAPCGDWFWMQHVDLSGVEYIGGDISASLIEANQAQFAGKGRTFQHLDITSDPLPASDLFLCRDCLFHLKTWLRWEFFRNFARSDSKYLLTTIVQTPSNRNLGRNGAFAAFNPMLAPFFLPEPLELIPETADELTVAEMREEKEGIRNRASGLWSREQIETAIEIHESAAVSA